MAHFGMVCDLGPSHVMNTTAIGRELQKRGHRVTLFAFPEFEDAAAVDGFDVWPSAFSSDLIEQRVQWLTQAEKLTRQDFLKFTIQRGTLVCEHGPAALRAAQVDCVLVDALDPGAATVAESLSLPFVTINNAVPLNQEASVPPDFAPWSYHDAFWAKARNWTAYRVRDLAIRPLHRRLNGYRARWGLTPYRSPDDSFSPYAQITQLIPEFDYPRTHLPPQFHYVGPYRREPQSLAGFPYDRLDGRPVIYASLGTVQGSRSHLWDAIALGCAGLEAQLVIALGKCDVPAAASTWPGAPIIVSYAPQIEMLTRAAVAILHGGMNSAMEALAAGVPTVTIPVIGDQFGVAARTVYSGTGEALRATRCRAGSLRPIVENVLHDHSYARRAHELKRAVERTKGAQAAADVIEEVANTRRPVLRQSMSASVASQATRT